MDTNDKEVNIAEVPEWNSLSIDECEPNFFEYFNKVISDEDIPETKNESQPQDDHNTEQKLEIFDSYIDMVVALPRVLDDGLFHAKVKWRAMDHVRNTISKETNKPITDTGLYEVKYIDGTIGNLAANVISENVLSQVNKEGHM